MSKDQDAMQKAVLQDALLEMDLLFGKLKREVARQSFVGQRLCVEEAVCEVECYPEVLGALEKRQEHE